MTASPRTGTLWAGIALVALLSGLLVAVPVVGFAESTLGLDHAVGLALWPVVWGIVAVTGVVVGAHLVFTVAPTIPSRAILVAGAGLAIAAAVQLALHGYSMARFGVIDPDLLGPVSFVFGLLVAVATAAFGVEIAPRRAVVAPATAAVVGAAATLGTVAMNLGGLVDGIDPVAAPLAWSLGCASLYAAAVLVRAARALARRPTVRLTPRTSLLG